MESMIDAVEEGIEYEPESFPDSDEIVQESDSLPVEIDSLPLESEAVPVLISGEVEEAEEIPEDYDLTGEDDELVIEEPESAELHFANLTIAGDPEEGEEYDAVTSEVSGDYTTILEDIKSALGSLVTSDDLDEYAQKIDELNDNVLTLNQNLVVSSQNQTVILRFQLGFIVAIFGALIIYFLFSKMH